MHPSPLRHLLLALTLTVLAACSPHPTGPRTPGPAYETTAPIDISDLAAIVRRRLAEADLPDAVRIDNPTHITIMLPTPSPLTPAEIDALLLPHHALEFRIAFSTFEFTPGQVAALKAPADTPQHLASTDARWIPITPDSTILLDRSLVTTRTADGRHWLLCHDDPAHTLTHDPPTPNWDVSASPPFPIPAPSCASPFELSPDAAKRMETLSASNVGASLALILDDQALTAPRLNGRISAQGEITLGNTPDQLAHARALKDAIDTAALPPLPLRRVP